MMVQKTQTLFIEPNGNIAQRIDDFLYHPVDKGITINDIYWRFYRIKDEFDCEGRLVRNIYLTE
ncbi:MAG: hypothetical protein ACOCVF_01175 [bacterium]